MGGKNWNPWGRREKFRNDKMISKPEGFCVTNLTCLYPALNPGTHRGSQWGGQRLNTMGTSSSIHQAGWVKQGPLWALPGPRSDLFVVSVSLLMEMHGQMAMCMLKVHLLHGPLLSLCPRETCTCIYAYTCIQDTNTNTQAVCVCVCVCVCALPLWLSW